MQTAIFTVALRDKQRIAASDVAAVRHAISGAPQVAFTSMDDGKRYVVEAKDVSGIVFGIGEWPPKPIDCT